MKKRDLLKLMIVLPSLTFGFGIQIDTSKRANLSTHQASEHSGGMFDSLWTPFETISSAFGVDLKQHLPKLGSPVHESLTLIALERAALSPKINWVSDDNKKVYAHDEILRGLLWNDDPNGYLFPYSKTNPKGFGEWELNGYKWLKEFALLELFRYQYNEAIENLPAVTQEKKELDEKIERAKTKVSINLLYDQDEMRSLILEQKIRDYNFTILRYEKGDMRKRGELQRVRDNIDFQLSKLTQRLARYNDNTLSVEDRREMSENDSEGLRDNISRLREERQVYMAQLADHRQLGAIKNNIMYASHFGNLQYLHAMGSNSQTRDEVKEKIMAHAKYCWRTATNELTLEMQLERIEREKTELLKSNKAAKGFRERFTETDLLYHTNNSDSLRHRALGSLLHMVQDSYAKGHAVRENWEGDQGDLENSGAIRYFQDYSMQGGGEHSHAEHDVNEEDPDNYLGIPGSEMAVRRSADLVRFFMFGCPWVASDSQHAICPEKGVSNYLGNDVFQLVEADEKGIMKHSSVQDESTATRSHPKLAPKAN